jgi:uncharacterized membrane protein (UPF0127 family)
MGRNARFWFLCFVFLGLGPAGCKQEIKSDLPMAKLTLRQRSITVEVANKAATRMTGLMFRRSLPRDQGMLFVFPDDTVRAFWMKNTQIPLSIAFIDDKGKIENILEMPPYSEDQFFSEGPAKYALEMNAGWFSRNGLKAGDPVEGVKSAPPATD